MGRESRQNLRAAIGTARVPGLPKGFENLTPDQRVAVAVGIAVGCAQILQRGFFGRLRWLLLGRH